MVSGNSKPLLKEHSDFDAVLFDLDGTLWDSREILADAWTRILNAHHIDAVLSAEKLTPLFGNELSYVIRHSVPDDVSEELINAIIPELTKAQVFSVRQKAPLLYRGVKNTLGELSKYVPIFIVSNSVTGYIDEFIHLSDTGKYITDYICNEDTGLSKGENIKLIAEKYELHHAVYVGDTMLDLKASGYAGMQFVYASYGFGDVDEFDYSIESLDDLIHIVVGQWKSK